MPTPNKAPKNAATKATKSPRAWPPPATADDLLACYRAGVGSRPAPSNTLATMELARVLAFRGDATGAAALRNSINLPGMRAIAIAEASLDEPDLERARALVEDAVFDYLEVDPGFRTGAAAAVLFAALRRLGDSRAEDRRPEIGAQDPAVPGFPFVEISRLFGVGARALCRVGEPLLAIALCRSQFVRPADRRELCAEVLSSFPDAAGALADTPQGHGDRCDMIQHGIDVLTTKGRHADALAWMRRFTQEGSVFFIEQATRGVVRAALAQHAPDAWGLWEAAFAPFEAAAAKRQYPGDRPFEREIARLLVIGAEADPGRVRGRLEGVVADMCTRELGKSASLGAVVADLAEASTRAGVDTTALRAMGGAFAACGVLRATDPSAPGWPELYAEVKRGLAAALKAGRVTTELVVALVLHLARVGRVDESRAVAEGLSAHEVVPAKARGGDLEGAWLTVKGLKKAERAWHVAPLFDAAIARGNLAAVVALAKELPGDVEVAMPAVARALMR